MTFHGILLKVLIRLLRNRKDRCGGEADFRRKFPDHGKNRVKLLVKCNFIEFWDKIISYNVKFYFSQILSSKINFAILFAVPERKGVTLVTEGLVFPSVGKMSCK